MSPCVLVRVHVRHRKKVILSASPSCTARPLCEYVEQAATPVTIDGYSGQELELQLPDDPFTRCDEEAGDSTGHAFVFSEPGLYAQGPANIWDLFILDVEGTRLIVVILPYAQTPQPDLDLARNIIETADILPSGARGDGDGS